MKSLEDLVYVYVLKFEINQFMNTILFMTLLCKFSFTKNQISYMNLFYSLLFLQGPITYTLRKINNTYDSLDIIDGISILVISKYYLYFSHHSSRDGRFITQKEWNCDQGQNTRPVNREFFTLLTSSVKFSSFVCRIHPVHFFCEIIMFLLNIWDIDNQNSTQFLLLLKIFDRILC